MNYFTGSYIVTAIGIILAWFWGEHLHHGAGFVSVFIVAVLAVLEVSISFDNAVVNAIKLEKMNERWRHRFLTWGIAIAVFGMRFFCRIFYKPHSGPVLLNGLLPNSRSHSVCAGINGWQIVSAIHLPFQM